MPFDPELVAFIVVATILTVIPGAVRCCGDRACEAYSKAPPERF
jgi:hypothetical protein